jgi:hypothetical protein
MGTKVFLQSQRQPVHYEKLPILNQTSTDPLHILNSIMADALKAEGNKLFAEKKFAESM